MDSNGDDNPGPSARRLSYKFQRLRERIRAAIDAGELAGKLPGERSLARQFNVNAKTLSKALTDLAAEGVLKRDIGLGTFVRDETVVPAATKVLLLADADSADHLTLELSRVGVQAESHAPDVDLLPSMLAPFDLVLIGSSKVSDAAVRDLVVRGKNVVTLDRLARPYTTHALLPHTAAAATLAAMQLVTLGHKRLLLIPEDAAEGTTAQSTVSRSVPTAEVRPALVDEASAAAREGYTAAIVEGNAAGRVIAECRRAGVTVPERFSVIGYGRVAEAPTCGHFITDAMVAAAIADLLTGGLPHKPLTLWLTAEACARGTTAALTNGPAVPSGDR